MELQKKIKTTDADIINPNKKFLFIPFGLIGFINNEQKSKEDKTDLKKTG